MYVHERSCVLFHQVRWLLIAKGSDGVLVACILLVKSDRILPLVG